MDIWKNTPVFNDFIKFVRPGQSVKIGGLTDGALGSIIASAFNNLKLNTLIITEREKDISGWVDILGSFTHERPLGFPADYPAHQIEVIRRLSELSPRIIVGCMESVCEKILSPKEFADSTCKIKSGETSYNKVVEFLVNGRYIRVDVVGEAGEFARRGEIIDFWPPDALKPVRILFKLDKVYQIKKFDPTSQRSTVELVEEAEIVPAEYSREARSTIKDYLGRDFIVLCIYEGEEDFSCDFFKPLKPRMIQRVSFHGADMEFNSRTLRYARSFLEIKAELEALKEAGYKIILTAPYKSELEKLWQIVLEEANISGDRMVSQLDEGFIVQDLKTAVLSIGDILPSHRGISYKAPPPVHAIEEFADLKPGDYVIHRKFGIGLLEGLEKKEHEGTVSDFLKLRYYGSGRLYVAVENADLIQKFIGSKYGTKLDSLSGKSWHNTTYRVRESVRDLSRKLLAVYKFRAKKGTSFKSHSEMEKEFADFFPYKLTRHQQQAVQEVLSDMESPHAMDRLVCGDVGYGKTEVAMRAAFRAVINGYQVALMAPTTVLARQHFRTFRERFQDCPVTIEMLSRLVSPSEQKKILQRINDGRVDIVIGTHKLLSEDIRFPSIGLVIIDEEQRFGVEQKEKLRFKFKNVDMLTTTATPIPRTLAMAFGRVKGFSLINTPPPGRIGVKTQIMPYNEEVVKNAIIHEVKRGGQCYYVHSRVGTISGVTKYLRDKLKGVAFKCIHGRMGSEHIERVMNEFIDGRFDCLVATTIIENGLDIPNVNTMIIDHSHRLGLADIYQLRGRIGRSNMRAYCYLMYPPDLDLTPQVKERLSALSSFSAMGSGFQLALRDLQMRGAGELLGPEQHGNIMKVGFDYYTSILKEEIAKLRGEEYVEPVEVEISIPVTAYIPENYIDSAGLRLAFYRRLSAVSETKDLLKVKEEMKDRFGGIPVEVKTLFKIIDIKINAAKAKIEEIAVKDSKLLLKLVSGEKIESVIDITHILKNVKNEVANIGKLMSK